MWTRLGVGLLALGLLGGCATKRPPQVLQAVAAVQRVADALVLEGVLSPEARQALSPWIIAAARGHEADLLRAIESLPPEARVRVRLAWTLAQPLPVTEEEIVAREPK